MNTPIMNKARQSVSTLYRLCAITLIGCTLIALLAAPPLQADWDPEYCLSYEDDLSLLNVLHDQKYKELKSNVSDYLANSWCSKEKSDLLMDLTLLQKPQVCVEVGAGAGSSLLPVATILKHLQQGTLYAIDAWSNQKAIENLAKNDPNRPWWSSVNMKEMYMAFKRTIKDWDVRSYCRIIAKPSAKAAQTIPAVDFLHLDGDYSEQGSLLDIDTYLPKVKTGGFILLSNILVMVNGTQPKLKAFCKLCEACEIVAEIENDNAVLFRKR